MDCTNLITGAGKVVHLPATPAGDRPKCDPAPAGGFSPYRRTSAEATCSRCLRSP